MVNVQLNFAAREVTIKLVYYGPALSGKTTNLKALHELTSEASHGRLMTLETRDDRTLFFDMLPLVFRSESGDMSLRLKVFTVPGQVLHGSTRRLVLQGADGVAFIADSQLSETENNAASLLDLKENLRELGIALRDMPFVIQFNKRDLPGIRTDAEINALAQRGREPIFKATAIGGKGVLESFFGLLELTWSKLEKEHGLAKMFQVDRAGFLPMAARQFGYAGDTALLLSKNLGGSLDFTERTAPQKGKG